MDHGSSRSGPQYTGQLQRRPGDGEIRRNLAEPRGISEADRIPTGAMGFLPTSSRDPPCFNDPLPSESPRCDVVLTLLSACPDPVSRGRLPTNALRQCLFEILHLFTFSPKTLGVPSVAFRVGTVILHSPIFLSRRVFAYSLMQARECRDASASRLPGRTGGRGGKMVWRESKAVRTSVERSVWRT